ncbi:spermatogenesis-associated protein 2-like protein isoform X2 [Hyla sarda]|nr:spermatogenesis-associated protein 2-like protein isoform X2 [Hyla sarda]XP_056381974.1 spermatogenesis-associated protein 2-like protein isoform X2 [Hyla sarda]XP_056381975.1 spermatogenesis-associated protein 2-like protein isoform X2 [Hyla sarda]
MSADILLAQYKSWLLSASTPETVTPCTDNKTIDLVRQRILEEPDLHNVLQNEAFHLISCGLQGKTDLLLTLQHLACAFQTLEQAALYLYFTPWRKEFHIIKTYSGHYVHMLKAVLPQDAIFHALKRLNYEPEEDGTSLKIQVIPAPKTLAEAALGFLAAQLECKILAELVSCSGSTEVNVTDLIKERQSWRGEIACMERLHKLVLKLRTVPVAKAPTVLGCDNGDILYQPQFCDNCHENWDDHVNRGCRMVIDHHVQSNCMGSHMQLGNDRSHTQVTQVDFIMHDCVFIQKSLEQCCESCHMFHSAVCFIVKGCREKGHNVTQMTSSEKMQAVTEEQGRKHHLHCCLQTGHLPHYRCVHCRQLHYINCEGVQQCRRQGHNVSMIMLEKDQRKWLQRSLMDLTLLCKNIPVHTSKA